VKICVLKLTTIFKELESFDHRIRLSELFASKERDREKRKENKK
jgi:hypothetical protein